MKKEIIDIVLVSILFTSFIGCVLYREKQDYEEFIYSPTVKCAASIVGNLIIEHTQYGYSFHGVNPITTAQKEEIKDCLRQKK